MEDAQYHFHRILSATRGSLDACGWGPHEVWTPGGAPGLIESTSVCVCVCVCVCVYTYSLFVFLGLHQKHMEVPRLGGPIRAAAARLHHSSRQHRILNPLSEARDQTHSFMDASREPQQELFNSSIFKTTHLELIFFKAFNLGFRGANLAFHSLPFYVCFTCSVILFFFSFFFCRVIPAAYGSSQARGRT